MSERISFSKSVRESVYKRFDGRCAYCGRPIAQSRFMQIDHIKSIYYGGGNEIDNLFPSCRSCNHYKSTMTLSDFRHQLSLIPGRMANSQDQRTTLAFAHGLIQVESNTVPVFHFESVDADFPNKDLCKDFERDMLEGNLKDSSPRHRAQFQALLFEWKTRGCKGMTLSRDDLAGLAVGYGTLLELCTALRGQLDVHGVRDGSGRLFINFPMMEGLIEKRRIGE